MENRIENYAYLNAPLSRYLDLLAAKLPCPGGGSVAALAACLASGLTAMAISFTLGKKAYRQHEERLQAIREANDRLRRELASFVEEDSRIFADMQQTAHTDRARHQEAVRRSLSLHLSVASAAREILLWDEELLTRGNPHLVSDVGISAVLARAAFFSARFNMEINFASCDDAAHVLHLRGQIAALEEEIAAKAQLVFSSALAMLQGGSHAGTGNSGK
jgi:formiminotetrahydrofolate cyclodeaminase